jgi:hypothetical protein
MPTPTPTPTPEPRRRRGLNGLGGIAVSGLIVYGVRSIAGNGLGWSPRASVLAAVAVLAVAALMVASHRARKAARGRPPEAVITDLKAWSDR